jgi:hypothetical protein
MSGVFEQHSRHPDWLIGHRATLQSPSRLAWFQKTL